MSIAKSSVNDCVPTVSKRMEPGDTGGKAELHHTYIGQLERGEKNATIESIYKVTTALDIPLSALFENISPSSEARDYASLSYDRIQKLPLPEREMLYEILERIIRFKQGTNSH